MKNFTRAGLFAGAIVLSTLGSASLHSSTESVQTKDYLLKVSNVMEAVQLVEAVGGSVTETAASISYLGATLTAAQLELLSRSDLVVRISENTVASSDETYENGSEQVAKIFWKKVRGNEFAKIFWKKVQSDEDEQVAKIFWKKVQGEEQEQVAKIFWKKVNSKTA